MSISRKLLGQIIDDVFDGAIEDASVIEEIYASIKRHEQAAGISDAERIKALEGYRDVLVARVNELMETNHRLRAALGEPVAGEPVVGGSA